ncbi:MAG: hypothetical protein ACI9VM_000688 [Candidatus Azotimanducaceae bacterium]|jgi:hypothetical protein
MSLKMRYSLFIILVLVVLLSIDRLTTPTTVPDMHDKATQFLTEHKKQTPPNSFSQDGCSLSPDKLLWHDFSTPCLEHDIAYWAGGTQEERKQADIALRDAISHTGPLGPLYSKVVYVNVRLFGDSFLTRIIDANWGYGWNE